MPPLSLHIGFDLWFWHTVPTHIGGMDIYGPGATHPEGTVDFKYNRKKLIRGSV